MSSRLQNSGTFLFVAIVLSPVIVSMTFFVRNDWLVLFDRHNSFAGQGVGYGIPFAYREVVGHIDTISVYYHWAAFALDVGVTTLVILLIFHLLERAK